MYHTSWLNGSNVCRVSLSICPFVHLSVRPFVCAVIVLEEKFSGAEMSEGVNWLNTNAEKMRRISRDFPSSVILKLKSTFWGNLEMFFEVKGKLILLCKCFSMSLQKLRHRFFCSKFDLKNPAHCKNLQSWNSYVSHKICSVDVISIKLSHNSVRKAVSGRWKSKQHFKDQARLE